MGDDGGNERRRRNRLALSNGQPARNLDRDPRWRDDAKCRGVDPDIFFPVGPQRQGPTSQARLDYNEAVGLAKRICADCPCCDSCLDFALATNQEEGVWGATDAPERRRLRKIRMSA